MSLLKRIRDAFQGGRRGREPAKMGLSGRGILVFHQTGEVIRAESLLRKAGLEVSVKGPPPEIRSGCDLVIEFPITSLLEVSRILEEAGIEPSDLMAVEDLGLEPVSLFHVKDLGDYLMVRAANMKITIAKADRRIVNISGGGCPDVPFLANELVGRTLDQAPEPRSLGKTLCGYALQLAYEELKRKCPG